MKQSITYFVMGIIASVIILFVLLSKGCVGETRYENVVHIDTVFVDKPYEVIEIKEIEKPVKITVYKTDTIYREKLIQDTLITHLEIEPKYAKIHTLTPEGIPLIKDYPLPSFERINIDHEGDIQIKEKKVKRQKFWRNAERIGLIVGGIWIGNQINKKS